MKKLDLYIGSSILGSLVLVVTVLVVLFSFLEFVSQLDDVGKGDYQLKDVFLFIGLTLPRRILDMMPISTLLGSIVALGLLADHGESLGEHLQQQVVERTHVHGELLAMQAGGMSVRRICWSVFATGTLLILATGILAEMLVPPMDQLARRRRASALSGTGITLTQQGFWARRGLSYIHVGKTLSGGMATNLDIFERDEKGRLKVFTHARQANIEDNKKWILRGIVQKSFTEQGIATQQVESLTLDSFLDSDQVDILELPPDSISFTDLRLYIQAFRLFSAQPAWSRRGGG